MRPLPFSPADAGSRAVQVDLRCPVCDSVVNIEYLGFSVSGRMSLAGECPCEQSTGCVTKLEYSMRDALIDAFNTYWGIGQFRGGETQLILYSKLRAAREYISCMPQCPICHEQILRPTKAKILLTGSIIFEFECVCSPGVQLTYVVPSVFGMVKAYGMARTRVCNE